MALKVEVVSREETVWTGEAKYVRARTTEGDMGIMTGHVPTLALLAEDGELLVEAMNGEKFTARLHEGFLTVSNNRVTIAATAATV
ncbi:MULTISPECIES: F0F1 ATP synthase subunit epsilon [unclassified Rothia (in: high G+C Gram-positive bacteria)]|uniref:F0F1 ATP synthase subunit epsilon n=1 Tax=unclassified Rothia (in: high G+C Gram-positive bacteria) TaxID=2689056 RepID=UPI00195AADAA|nr:MULTISPECIES: F0F1 ATP synthase subunit epsilon [unclassified Rothia (in: high G+C Gram-positive bacteria)]MBM7050989.1 F0F1 ATP synthase subunit epsilon [Rothia sp. ZJ1223]QRZ62282.1 F0F1 ATP synthase subunit epsilon [Rothia sp. ZJ932]